MILQDAFTVEPWNLRETRLDLDLLAQTESVFALANGHVGWRANLDEGEPHGLPGSYLNGVYESRPLPLRRGRLRPAGDRAGGHQRDQRQADPAVRRRRAVRRPVRRAALARAGAGLPRRAADPARRVGVAGRAGGPGLARSGWCPSPSGRSRRSATRWSRWTARPGSPCSRNCWPNEQLPPASDDPRVPAALENPLSHEFHERRGQGRAAGAQDQAQRAARRRRDGSPASTARPRSRSSPGSFEDGGLVTAATVLEPGQKLRVVKFVAYGWSGERSLTGRRATRCGRR